METNKVDEILEKVESKWVPFLKKSGDIIIFALVGFIVLYLILILFIGTPSYVKETIQDNKKIEVKIDSLHESQKFIEDRMMQLEKNQFMFFEAIDQTNSKIDENNRKLDNLKRVYNEKIRSVDNYTISQLDSFFTARYKEYYK